MSQPEGSSRSLLDAGELAAIARRLGGEITRDYPDGVVLVALLKGSICFLADLVREMHVACELDFLALSAYGDGRTRVRVVKDLDLEVAGRDVVVVLDIVDTGLRSPTFCACSLCAEPVRRSPVLSWTARTAGCCQSRSAT